MMVFLSLGALAIMFVHLLIPRLAVGSKFHNNLFVFIPFPALEFFFLRYSYVYYAHPSPPEKKEGLVAKIGSVLAPGESSWFRFFLRGIDVCVPWALDCFQR